MAEIKKVLEGSTGAEASQLLFENDTNLNDEIALNTGKVRLLDEKISYLIKGTGPIATYDNCTWKTGYYLNMSGVENVFDTFSYCTNYIPVHEGEAYVLQCSGISIIWYDNGFNVVGASGGVYDEVAIRTFYAPGNAAYCRVNQPNNILRQFELHEGTTLETYSIKKNVIDLLDLSGVNKIEGEVLTNYNMCTWVNGYYLAPNGTANPYSSFSYTENYIPVQSNAKYTLQTIGNAICWYDVNKTVVGSYGGATDPLAIRTVTSPSNAQYMRVNQSNATIEDFVIWIGEYSGYTEIPALKINSSQVIGFGPDQNYFTVLKKTILDTISIFNFQAYPIEGNIITSGDSTIADYAGGAAVASFLTCTGTKSDISVPGNTIDQQLAAWNALSSDTRSAANWVFVQIGLNDLDPEEAANDAIARLQLYLNKIKTDAPNAKIIGGTMLPCKQRLINIYGETEGLVSFQKWLAINLAVTNTIEGIDKTATIHTYYLDDGNGNLAPAYDTGDGIHENTTARRIIAYSWLTSTGNL